MPAENTARSLAEDEHHHHPPHLEAEAGGEHDHTRHAGHTHGAVDPSLFASERGLWAVKWSLVGMLATALFQVIVVIFSGSVGLLADTIHNFGDGLTALPLWFAFRLGQRPANRRYTYGYGRMEDLAGLVIVLMILISVIVAAYESIQRFFHPQDVKYLWAVAIAAIIGFIGNEGVAYFRIRVGKEIGSAALVADGLHARADGLTSLAVLIGAAGVALGFPLADPLAGLLISAIILKILWDSAKTVFTRLLDGVDPEVPAEIEHAAGHIPGVEAVNEVRVRWLGHRMHAELSVAVDPALSVGEGHALAREVHHQLLHHLPYLSEATIHIDPADEAGRQFHAVGQHAHDDLPAHEHL